MSFLVCWIALSLIASLFGLLLLIGDEEGASKPYEPQQDDFDLAN